MELIGLYENVNRDVSLILSPIRELAGQNLLQRFGWCYQLGSFHSLVQQFTLSMLELCFSYEHQTIQSI